MVVNKESSVNFLQFSGAGGQMIADKAKLSGNEFALFSRRSKPVCENLI